MKIFYEKLGPLIKPIIRNLKYLAAIIIFLILAGTYEFLLFPSYSKDIIIAIIGGVISGIVVLMFQKGVGDRE